MTDIREALEALHKEQIAKANTLFAEGDQKSAMIVFARAEGIEIALEKLRAALASHGTGWRDISTAPKDGTAFAATDGHYVFRTHWQAYYENWPHEDGGPTYRHEWTYEDRNSLSAWKPTLWLPLPCTAPPETPAKEPQS